MAKPPYPLHPEPMQKSWVERHPLWKIPLGLLIILLLLIVFGMVVFTVVTASFRHSDAYQQAMRIATSDPHVRQQLGEPIQAAWAVSGELNVSRKHGPREPLDPHLRPSWKRPDSGRCGQERRLEIFLPRSPDETAAPERSIFCRSSLPWSESLTELRAPVCIRSKGFCS